MIRGSCGAFVGVARDWHPRDTPCPSPLNGAHRGRAGHRRARDGSSSQQRGWVRCVLVFFCDAAVFGAWRTGCAVPCCVSHRRGYPPHMHQTVRKMQKAYRAHRMRKHFFDLVQEAIRQRQQGNPLDGTYAPNLAAATDTPPGSMAAASVELAERTGFVEAGAQQQQQQQQAVAVAQAAPVSVSGVDADDADAVSATEQKHPSLV